MPVINMEVYKQGQKIETITLENKPVFSFGRINCDVPLLHDSISRIHAVIVMDTNLGIVVVDMMSKAGTKVNGVACEPC